MYKSDARRITVSFRVPSWRTTIEDALVRGGWTRRMGRAPESFMEHELQDWLDLLVADKYIWLSLTFLALWGYLHAHWLGSAL